MVVVLLWLMLLIQVCAWWSFSWFFIIADNVQIRQDPRHRNFQLSLRSIRLDYRIIGIR
jgi:hypothetical protein